MVRLFIALLVLFMASISSAGMQAPRKLCGSGGNSCNPATDYIGLSDTAGTSQTAYQNVSYTFLFTPSCSGPLNTAYLYHNNTTAQTAYMAIYLDDGDGTPDSGDSLVDSSGSNLSSNSATFASSALGSGASVSTGNNYWIVFEPSSAEWQYKYSSVAGAYYKTTSFAGSWPANLPNTWTSASRKPVMYMSIGD